MAEVVHATGKGAWVARTAGGMEYNLANPAPVYASSSATLVPPSDEGAADARLFATQADELCQQGNFANAVKLFARSVQLQPREAEFHYKMACAAWSAGEMGLVQARLLEAARLNPTHPAVQEALALWFSMWDNPQRACEHAANAVALRPGNVGYLVTHADALAAAGKPQAAWELLGPLIESGTISPWIARVYAKVAVHIGHETRAINYAHRVFRSPGISSMDQIRVRYALANLLDRVGQYDDAFDQARLAGLGAIRKFDPASHSSEIYTRIGYYSRRRLKSLPRATHGDTRPVFIVGMPRSGTSLVEQILASHPQVYGAGELTRLSEIVRSASSAPWSEGQEFPDCFDFLSLRRANMLADEYLSSLDSFSMTATYITDKMPLNYLFLGTIQLLFPDCHVIHCVRDPRDTCLSCFMTDFTTGHEFSNDLFHAASYYRDYARLMEHWHWVLKLPVLEVRYESLVADLPGQTQRMLNFLKLPWTDRCLNFHENPRPVATASREQVRRPLYSSSVGRWKHYEKHLGPLAHLTAPGESE